MQLTEVQSAFSSFVYNFNGECTENMTGTVDASLKQRQEEELEVIRAIYITEVKDLQQNKDHTTLKIQLGPQRGCSVSPSVHQNTSILLCLTLPANYPNVEPKISLEEVKGISSQEVEELKQGLKKMSTSHVGQEMILNLAQFSQDFLFQHQKRPTGSFYDEMLMRNQLQEENTRRKEKEFYEQEVLGIKYEIEKRKEMLKEEARTRKEELKMLITKDNSDDCQHITTAGESREQIEGGKSVTTRMSSSLRRSNGENETQRATSRVKESTDLIEIAVGKSSQKYQLGEVLDHNLGYNVYAAMETEIGSLATVSEWIFTFSPTRKTAKDEASVQSENYELVTKQLANMESEVRLLQKLRHANIVSHIGVAITRLKSTIAVHTVQEFVRGVPLKACFDGMLCVDIPLIRHCAKGILNALAFLHSNNIVHRYLRDTNIFLTAQDVKVGGYGLERKLGELLLLLNDEMASPDPFAPSIGRGAKKSDIYRLGIIVLSLFKEDRVVQSPPELPTDMPTELHDFLKKCVDVNENDRWAAHQLLDHPFLKVSLDKRKELRISCQQDQDCQEQLDPHNEEILNFLSHSLKGHSRLRDEFEIADWLGKGGFGDVLKVRNKLDGGVYALKRIRLNPRNRQLNRKITREVKLLSRLNHENVVRYYNSWIETVPDTFDESEDTSSHSTLPTPKKVKSNITSPLKNIQNSLGITDNLEELAPKLASTMSSDWGSGDVGKSFNEDTDDSSDDDDDLFGTSFMCPKDVSEDVVFDNSGSRSTSPTPSESNDGMKTSSSSIHVANKQITNMEDTSDVTQKDIQFMYIQMEFCEKSTLRTAIDANLYQDMDRALRLFREIVEGLSHIHQQGMIHRDLKPVNIFLDSYDHVKIGDFGLATTEIFIKNPGGEVTHAPTPIASRQSDFAVEESLTTNVGTALYVAPELVHKSLQGSKVVYSQKVDIYSLGIVFFEMIYHPIGTGMERIRVITSLRQKEINFPTDFDIHSMSRQTILLKWLLNHDPRLRPTSLELLQSEYLPPPQMEETEMREMFRHTLANSQSKLYKYLISSCFRQQSSAAEELTYDMDILRTQINPHGRNLTLQQFVKRTIQRICIQHGAVEINSPLLLPKLPLYGSTSSQVRLMTHSGNVVCLQHDLRVPFARYIVSNGIVTMKRFAIEKVYRERKVFGFHPREFYECAFDVISSGQGSLLPEAEALAIVFEIFQEFSWMRDKHFTVRLGHTYLLDAVLLHFSIDEALHFDIKSILMDIKIEKQVKSQVQTRLVSLGLPDQFISLLFTLMDIEGPLPKVVNILKSIVKRNGVAASRIKEGLHELQVLIDLIDAFGLPCEVVVAPTMIFGSDVYSGLIYQITCQIKKKRNRVTIDVVALGGKYDELLKRLRGSREAAGITPPRELEQCGVGISLSLDLLISGCDLEDVREGCRHSFVDVIVCSLGHHVRTKEKIALLKKFWANGISCTATDNSENLETAEEQCVDLGASFIVVLKEDSFNSNLRVRYLDKQRFLEKKLSITETMEFIQSRLGGSGSSTLPLKSDPRANVQASDSSAQVHQGSSVPSPCINVSFVITESRDKPANWKRRQESMMLGNISEALRKISKQQMVELVGVEADGELVKILTSDLDISDKDVYSKTVSEIVESRPRQKKILKAICDELYELIFVKNSEIIVIYSLTENFYKTLI